MILNESGVSKEEALQALKTAGKTVSHDSPLSSVSPACRTLALDFLFLDLC